MALASVASGGALQMGAVEWVTIDTRQHCTDDTGDKYSANPNVLATLMSCAVEKLSAHC